MSEIRKRIQENAKQIAASFALMPKCECGHARIKHGVYCDNSCVETMCDCYRYSPKTEPKQ